MKTDNELIAEFMGLPLTKKEPSFTGGWKEVPFQRWKYDSSWDWLMPVVEKIYLLREVKQVSITPGKTRIWFANHIKNSFIESPCKPENNSITECYLAVIEFIKWHNSQNP